MPKEIYLELNEFEADITKKNTNITVQNSFFNKDEFSMNLSLEGWNKFIQAESKKIKCNYDLKLDKFHLDDFLDIFDSKGTSSTDYQIDLEEPLPMNLLIMIFSNVSQKTQYQ